MLRRAASGHIEATQLSKFAAASRIALAVIRGWPEAPSSPLQGSGALLAAGAACACAEVAGLRWRGGLAAFRQRPVKMLSRDAEWPAAAGRLRARRAAQQQRRRHDDRAGSQFRQSCHRSRHVLPHRPKLPLSGGLVEVSNRLTKAVFCRGILVPRGGESVLCSRPANRLPTCDQAAMLHPLAQGITTSP